MIHADDDFVREIVRAQLFEFVRAAHPRSVRDSGAVLAAFIAEAALGMYTSVGTDVTVGVLEHVLSQMKAQPHRPIRPDVFTRAPSNDPKASP